MKDFVERLRVLSRDVFEIEAKANVSKKRVIVARKNPNWCQTAEDMPNRAVIKSSLSIEEVA